MTNRGDIILSGRKCVSYLQFRNGGFATKRKAYEIFDRTEEIASLREILELSKSNAQLTVVTGRRRIAKKQPIFEKSPTKNVRYTIGENFFTFWFRFIYKYNYMLEIENYDAVKTIINRDYETFSGLMLERYFRQLLIERKEFTRIGSWWDRKGENEIDIVAENELTDEATFIEVKRNSENFDPEVLSEKVEVFTRATGRFNGYSVTQRGLSMSDM